MASSANAFKSREEFKRAKELEEARKAGTAAPEVDEEGNDINPHIPQYISQAPWYVKADGPTLKHQKSWKRGISDGKDGGIGTWYKRGRFQGAVATKYRKGACENCGAMTHKKKDCFERPRKKGARWTGVDIKGDEVVGDVKLSWEGKRDRWNGYDVKDYGEVVKKWRRLDDVRRDVKGKDLDRRLKGEEGGIKESDDGDFKQGDAGDVVIQESRDGKERATIRNLRIREDTAKYLRNLDVNSAYYDPKTRSMRADPTPHVAPEDKDYAGDNFVRYTGEVPRLASLFLHASKNQDRALPHLQAEPTRAEAMYKDFETKKKIREDSKRKAVIDRYGPQDEFEVPRDLALMASERYTEYSRDGKVLDGEEVRPSSRYEEDVLEGNHTQVWGSWWENGKWGYACCHGLLRKGWCTGEKGKRAKEEAKRELQAQIRDIEKDREQRTVEEAKDKRREQGSGKVTMGTDIPNNRPTAKQLEDRRIKQHLADDPMKIHLNKKN